MKVQVKKFSTHQTAKVFAILVAVTSLLIIIPFSLLSMLMPSPVDASGNEITSGSFGVVFLIMPIFQGMMGYIMMRIGLWVYNKIAPSTGGIEFELEEIKS